MDTISISVGMACIIMRIISMEIEMYRRHHAIMIRSKGIWSRIVFKRHPIQAILKRHMN